MGLIIFLLIIVGIIVILTILLIFYFTVKTTPYGPMLFLAGLIRRYLMKNAKKFKWFDLEFRRTDNENSLKKVMKKRNVSFPPSIVGIDQYGSVLQKVTGKKSADYIIFFIHGGGFVMGNSYTYADVLEMISTNSDVYSLDYPLSPENPYPAAVESTLAGYEFLRNSHPDQKIIVCGDSAGGNLAAGLCISCEQKQIQQPDGLVLIYPFLNLVNFDTPSYLKYSENYALSRQEIQWFTDMYCPDEALRPFPLVSPLFVEKPDFFPPTFIFSAGYDVLLDDGTIMKHLLEISGIDVEYYCYPHLFHGFIILGKYLKEPEDLFKKMNEWVNRKIL